MTKAEERVGGMDGKESGPSSAIADLESGGNQGTEGTVDGQSPTAPFSDPILLVEYCVTWLPADLARLPELDLGEGLMRPLHCYAHGGFMGAAISMLADPEVRC